jgi:hypothetical protein
MELWAGSDPDYEGFEAFITDREEIVRLAEALTKALSV